MNDILDSGGFARKDDIETRRRMLDLRDQLSDINRNLNRGRIAFAILLVTTLIGLVLAISSNLWTSDRWLDFIIFLGINAVLLGCSWHYPKLSFIGGLLFFLIVQIAAVAMAPGTIFSGIILKVVVLIFFIQSIPAALQKKRVEMELYKLIGETP